ncbi:MAG TPA: hypothetical protein VFZ54_16240 [Burkholderiales bacterium]
MKNRYPTSAELYALERDARRMRAEYMARLSARLVRAVSKGWHSVWAAKAVKGLRHA